MGAVPIIHPVLDAVVYFNPVTCIHRWKTAMQARIKILPWFLRLIVNFLFVMMAIMNNRMEANRSRRAIIVTGSSSARTLLVATNEVPQNITANRISRYLNVFDLCNDYGRNLNLLVTNQSP
jgi:hypothetical protein